MHPLLRLADETARHLERTVPEEGSRALRDAFVADLDAVGSLPPNDRPAATRPVRGLAYAPTALAAPTDPSLSALIDAARSAFAHVRWSEFYAPDPWSEPFLARFANGEGIGPDGALRSDHLILGLFVLGPDTLYPAHAHPAEEFYLTLSGEPSFQIGARSEFTPIPPGEVAWHGSNVSHAIRTGGDPFFAVFGWRGAIDERSWYRDDMAGEALPARYPTIAKG